MVHMILFTFRLKYVFNIFPSVFKELAPILQ